MRAAPYFLGGFVNFFKFLLLVLIGVFIVGFIVGTLCFGVIDGLQNQCNYDRAFKYFPTYYLGCELTRLRE